MVFVRSDWSRIGPTPRRPSAAVSGCVVDALKLLHEHGSTLFHGHEPLDTHTTATLEGEEAWVDAKTSDTEA